MAYKAKKLSIDLNIDVTEYIPETDGGMLSTTKTDAENIREWFEIAVKEGENLQRLSNEKKENNDFISLSDLTKEGEKSIIKQIDYFYEKGFDFYKKIPSIELQRMLEYINEQLLPAKKK